MKFQANILQAIVAMLLVCDGNISFCAEVPNSLDEVETTLRQAPLFKEPLIWVGSERPPESQTRALYEIAAVEAWNDNASADEKVSRFESFIAQYPDSAWNPALLANLGVYYRSEGRYTKALERWSEAWRRTANLTDYRSRHVAAFTAAYWSQLLSSLGRIDDMEALLAVVKTDVTAKSLFAKEIEAANRSLAIMKNQPAAAFRCGTFALFHAAQAFGEASKCQSLLSLNSPRSGFSLQNLVEFSANYQLGFAAVHRGSGGELIVPSVVHWKENHYAAIVEKRRGAYKVIDPTFGGSKWLSAAVINENASGYFLIQSGDHPASWRSVDPDEASTVFGKGIENNGEPNPSGCPCGTCPPPCAPGSPGSGNGGNGPGSCGSACGVRVGAAKAGMPDWEVQEPYISLWLHDRPMFYDLSLGGQFALDMTYHQRETRAAPGSWNTNVFNFGPSWNCNLLTYILVKGTVTHDQETVDCDPESESECCTQAVVTGNIELSEFAPKGGLRRHVWDGELAPWLRDTRTHAQLKPVGYDTVTTLPSACGYSYDQRVVHFKTATLDYPDGSTAAFGLVVTTSTLPEEKLAFITSLTNPQGQVMRYHYYTNVSVPNKPIVRLAHVVDFDGNTNSFLYEDANFSSAVTAITNANYKLGVAFRYDTNGFLTNIVDTIGLASSFQYTFTNDLFFQGYNTNGQPGNPDQYGGFTEPPHTNQVWLLTRMSTPYGDTSFEYIHPTWRMFTPSSAPSVEAEINRAIRVTQPDGGTHLFMYLDRHNPMVTGPYLYPTLCGSEGSDYLENYLVFKQRTSKHADIHLVDFNSYYWGPRQYARLSTTVITNFNYTDYRGARVRNWLHSNPDVNDFSTSQTLNAEQAPSPDPENSVSSQSIWYGYEGKPADADIVESQSDNIPVTVGYQTDDFAIRIQNSWRNTQGLVTKTVDFGSDVSCEHFIKTNLYVYAANGIDLVKHIGPGNLMLGGYAYNAFHQITFATNALGEVTSYTYVSNRLTSTKLPSGLITTNIYGANGFIAVTYDYAVVAGTPVYYRTNAYTYTNGLVFTHTDERGLTVTNTWDKLQRLLSVKYSDGRSISYTYDKLDLVRIVDRMGFTNSFVYDNMQRKIFETNALGRVTAYSYCTCGSLNSVQDAAGQNTFFYYDNLGRLTNTLFADGFSIRREYDLASQIRRTIDSSGHTVIKTYDGEGNLQAVDKDHPIGPQRTAQFSYDIYDRVTTNINAEGVKVTMTYDPLGRLRTRTYPDNGVESFGYTLNVSGATSYTNQLNQVTRYVYDPLERKTAETNANLEVTRFVYNGAGDLLTLTDGKNQTTAWKYDSFGRVTNKLDHLGTNLFLYGYDFNHRLASRESGAKGLALYRYDAVGNLTNLDYAVSPDIHLRYDAVSRLTNMVDAVGTTVYSYTAAGQLQSEDGPWASDTVSYAYDHRRRQAVNVQAFSASDWTQSYEWDVMQRLTAVTSPAGRFGYRYGPGEDGFWWSDLAGSNPWKITLPNGAAITNEFDANGRLLSTELLRLQDGERINSHRYAYNLGNQRSQQVFSAGNSVDYTYDPIGQLKTARGKEFGGITNRLHEQLGYVYDAAGNLNYRTNNGMLQSFTVNSLNQPTGGGRVGTWTVSGGTMGFPTNVTVNASNAFLYADGTFASTNHSPANTFKLFTAVARDALGRADTNTSQVFAPPSPVFSYDSNGNLLVERSAGGVTNRIFDYDDENQLIRVMVTNAWKSEFTYDGKMRRRIRKEYTWSSAIGNWQLTNEVRYVYDGNLVIQERDANNLPQVTYTRGTDLSGTFEAAGGIGGLLARTDNGQMTTGNGHPHAYYHADGNGNITCLIDTNQLIAARYHYDPFGNILGTSGPLAERNLHQFSSKEQHSQSGLVYYLYRYYEPSLQRWLNRDPIEEEGGVNLYRFAGNAPGNKFDAFGFSIVDPFSGEDPFEEHKDKSPICEAIRNSIRGASQDAAMNPDMFASSMAYLFGLWGLYYELGCDGDDPPPSPPPRVPVPCPTVNRIPATHNNRSLYPHYGSSVFTRRSMFANPGVVAGSALAVTATGAAAAVIATRGRIAK